MIREDGNGGWWAGGEVDLTTLPQGFIPGGTICDAEHPTAGYGCTRNRGHTGRHASMAGPYLSAPAYVLAVWR